ncbi:hypothetical protein A3C96_00370 [Candidatus Uhrbacteria bacterium RIFCSPHIGHO2_02_FULL_60_10]|uniref:Peptidase M16 C-terminal domain-containing protein n=1 Tax=Candidatus Uhrbacteria bacterium RIFCSPHIGHO2_02_FULL_60_10 TaxID=1802392 RepID=A0A1F7U7R5_9BACT|nr:MAG: hypothetical protein A3C96_00370 [Candidatus Uhrbacteria bacterium RIFCSPHIGHO2_02_FULL_60_10]
MRPEVVDAERSIITEEMRMIMDDPMRLVDDQLDAAVYAGSPLARFICGTPESVLGIGRDELVAYRDAHYRPERTVVVVAGAFNPAVARRLVKERFGRQKSLGRKPAVASKVRPPLDGPRLKLLDKPTEQAHLALGFPAVRLGDSRLPAVKMLSVILGGGMSSRLFSEVREKRGLAYAVWSHCHTYEDTGHFSVQLGTSPDKAVTALEVAIGELRRIATEGVSVAELAAAKEFVKGKTLMAMDDPGALAEFYGKQALMEGKVETLKARIAKLQAVTPAKVKAAAQMIFRPGRASFAAIGPFQDEAPFLRAIAKL